MTLLPSVPYWLLTEFGGKGTVFVHQNFMSLFARVGRKSRASTGQLAAWSSLSFSVLTLNLCVTDVKMLKMISTSEVLFFLLKKNIMKMKAYIYLLSRKQLGDGCPPQQGNLNSVITGRGLKTIRTRNVELNPLKWCDQIKRDKGMWWSIIKKQIMRWMLICSNVLCWLRALEHEALVFAVLSVGNDS